MINHSNPIYIGTNDPEYYAVPLKNAFKLADRRLSSEERYCPDVTDIEDVDSPLARRLRMLLDVVAGISLCQCGNGSATMARFTNVGSTLETDLYIIFNHQNDKAAHLCRQHLQSIFEILRKVPYRPPGMDISPKDVAAELEINLVELPTTIHNYSFDIFVHRVNKRKDKLSLIQQYLERDQKQFTTQHHNILSTFLWHVDLIITTVADAQDVR